MFLPQVFSTNLFTWSSILFFRISKTLERGEAQAGSRKISAGGLQGDIKWLLISPIRKFLSSNLHISVGRGLGAKEGTLDLSCGVFKRESEVDMEEDDDGGNLIRSGRHSSCP